MQTSGRTFLSAAAPAPQAGRNRLEVLPSSVSGGRVVFRYEVSGEWAECFRAGKSFFVEYPFDAERVPEGVRIVPFLSQVLPVAWICDAEVRVPACDRDFFECLEAVEDGYRAMHPRIAFGGKLVADRLERGALKDVCLATFGVGLSWGFALLDLSQASFGGVGLYKAPSDRPTRAETVKKWIDYYRGGNA